MSDQNVTSTLAPTATKTVMVPRETPVPERRYQVMAKKSLSFRGKQRQIVYDILLASSKALTIKEVARAATLKGLVAIGGVEPSCRYHLHYLAKDANQGFPCVRVVNPTTMIPVEIAVEPEEPKPEGEEPKVEEPKTEGE